LDIDVLKIIAMVKLKNIIFILFALLIFQLTASAQDTEVEEDYISEFIYGLNLNTNGGLIGGFNFKWTKIVKPRHYRTIGLEIVGIKDPKEFRTPSFSGNTFLYGKTNYLYSFRPQYGRDIILFRKAPEKGIQITANFAAGPSLGLLVPYYILYADDNGELIPVAFDFETHNPNFIYGAGNFLEGLGDAKFFPGVNAKVGLSFDFSAFRNNITGMEAGFTFEGFANKPEIVSKEIGKTRNIFTAAYVLIFLGSRK
jgi:hypothetical protein